MTGGVSVGALLASRGADAGLDLDLLAGAAGLERRVTLPHVQKTGLALAGFDVGISGLAAGVNVLLTLPDGSEHGVLRRAGEAGIALQGLSRLRHPQADVADRDGVIVGFAAPAEHAFAAAVDALCDVLRASGL